MAARLRRRDHDAVQLLDELRREHDVIDRLLGALLAVPPGPDALAMIEIFERYAGGWHHEREEGVLFPALPCGAPIATLTNDHRAMAARLQAMRASLGDAAAFARHADAYARALWPHIDAENSVLFPESEIQLKRSGVRELPVADVPAEVRELEARAEILIAKYPAKPSDVVRGEGCVVCPAYGDACSGIEREWWNEWEWEALNDLVAGA